MRRAGAQLVAASGEATRRSFDAFADGLRLFAETARRSGSLLWRVRDDDRDTIVRTLACLTETTASAAALLARQVGDECARAWSEVPVVGAPLSLGARLGADAVALAGSVVAQASVAVDLALNTAVTERFKTTG